MKNFPEPVKLKQPRVVINIALFNRVSTKAEEGLPTSDFQLPTSDFRLQASGFRLQAAGFRLQASGFRLQASVHGPPLIFKRKLPLLILNENLPEIRE